VVRGSGEAVADGEGGGLHRGVAREDGAVLVHHDGAGGADLAQGGFERGEVAVGVAAGVARVGGQGARVITDSLSKMSGFAAIGVGPRNKKGRRAKEFSLASSGP
jgi:hypothetical protein